MRPALTIAPRRLLEPARIGGWTLPAGVHVTACLWLSLRRDDLWPQAAAFRPERWLAEPPPDPAAWVPFGGGVRRCAGAPFAEMEMRAVLRAAASQVTLRPARARGRAGPAQRPRGHAGARRRGDRGAAPAGVGAGESQGAVSGGPRGQRSRRALRSAHDVPGSARHARLGRVRRRRARLREAQRPLPAQAARALLPHRVLGRGLRGPRSGDLPARVAEPRELPRPVLCRLALPDRDQRLHGRAQAASPAGPRSPPSPTRRRCSSAFTEPRRSPSRHSSTARRLRSPSRPPSSTSRRASAPCSCCVPCSAGPRRTRRCSSSRAWPRSTARSSGRAATCTNRLPEQRLEWAWAPELSEDERSLLNGYLRAVEVA